MVKYTRFPPTGTEVQEVHAPTDPESVRAGNVADPRSRPGQETAIPRERLHPVVLIFLISLVIPVYFFIGPIRMSPSRLVLVVMAIPVSIAWITGKCGRIRLADMLFIGCGIWSFLGLQLGLVPSSPQFAAVTVIELIVPYFIARRYLRTEAQYRAMTRALLWIAIFLLPAAVAESLTGFRLYNKIFSFMATHPWANYDTRLHMFRAQTVFEHPILYGVFVALFFAPVYFSARPALSWISALIRATPVLAATFFSLSAGALLGLNIQLIMMAYGKIFRSVRHRWKILAVLTVIGYIAIDLISNRTPIQVFSSYLAFDSGTAFMRVLIAKYGLENVWMHPLFGLGISSEWVRPEWMYSSSVDNFWLAFAMRYGIPGFLTMLCGYLAVLSALMRAKPTTESAAYSRDGLTFALIGLGIAIYTVFLWSASFDFVMFMFGAGAWISDQAGLDPAGDDKAKPATGRGSLTRDLGEASGPAARAASGRARSSGGPERASRPLP